MEEKEKKTLSHFSVYFGLDAISATWNRVSLHAAGLDDAAQRTKKELTVQRGCPNTEKNIPDDR